MMEVWSIIPTGLILIYRYVLGIPFIVQITHVYGNTQIYVRRYRILFLYVFAWNTVNTLL